MQFLRVSCQNRRSRAKNHFFCVCRTFCKNISFNRKGRQERREETERGKVSLRKRRTRGNSLKAFLHFINFREVILFNCRGRKERREKNAEEVNFYFDYPSAYSQIFCFPETAEVAERIAFSVFCAFCDRHFSAFQWVSLAKNFFPVFSSFVAIFKFFVTSITTVADNVKFAYESYNKN